MLYEAEAIFWKVLQLSQRTPQRSLILSGYALYTILVDHLKNSENRAHTEDIQLYICLPKIGLLIRPQMHQTWTLEGGVIGT